MWCRLCDALWTLWLDHEKTDGFERQIPGGPGERQEFQPAEMLGTIYVYGVYLAEEDGLDS